MKTLDYTGYYMLYTQLFKDLVSNWPEHGKLNWSEKVGESNEKWIIQVVKVTWKLQKLHVIYPQKKILNKQIAENKGSNCLLLL